MLRFNTDIEGFDGCAEVDARQAQISFVVIPEDQPDREVRATLSPSTNALQGGSSDLLTLSVALPALTLIDDEAEAYMSASQAVIKSAQFLKRKVEYWCRHHHGSMAQLEQKAEAQQWDTLLLFVALCPVLLTRITSNPVTLAHQVMQSPAFAKARSLYLDHLQGNIVLDDETFLPVHFIDTLIRRHPSAASGSVQDRLDTCLLLAKSELEVLL